MNALPANKWFQPPIESYLPGKRLTLSLGENSSKIDVLIVKAFTPFTWSAALLVELQSQDSMLPSRFVVKLADRRLYHFTTMPWTVDVEEDYQSHLLSHTSKFGLGDEFYDFSSLEDDEYLPWMRHLDRWKQHQILHSKERKAYELLSEAQALGLVPRFFGAAMLSMVTSESAAHSSLTHINALLLEYVPGRLMSSLKPGITITFDEAEAISQRVLQLGRLLRRYGVAHNDIHTGNIILRSPDDSPVLIDWGRADVNDADLSPRERWDSETQWQDFYLDIRCILNFGYRDSNGPLTPSAPGVGIWHRHCTPLADDVQVTLAREHTFQYVNNKIQALSPQALDFFYDEDKTVDPQIGLRWKVKQGIKTALKHLDDPFLEQ